MTPFTLTALLLLFFTPLSHGAICKNDRRTCYLDDPPDLNNVLHVKRDPKNGCSFPPCPPVLVEDFHDSVLTPVSNCPPDLKYCPYGNAAYIRRDPNLQCKFPPCPGKVEVDSDEGELNDKPMPSNKEPDEVVPDKMPNDKPIEESETTTDEELRDDTKDAETKDNKPMSVKNKEPVSEIKPGRGSSRLRRQHKKNGHW